jgi:hypothetical protein
MKTTITKFEKCVTNVFREFGRVGGGVCRGERSWFICWRY